MDEDDGGAQVSPVRRDDCCVARDWCQPFFSAITKASQTVRSFTFECVWPISSVAIVTASALSASVLHLKIKSNWAQMKQLATVLPSQSPHRSSRQPLGLLGSATHFCRFSHVIFTIIIIYLFIYCYEDQNAGLPHIQSKLYHFPLSLFIALIGQIWPDWWWRLLEGTYCTPRRDRCKVIRQRIDVGWVFPVPAARCSVCVSCNAAS